MGGEGSIVGSSNAVPMLAIASRFVRDALRLISRVLNSCAERLLQNENCLLLRFT